MQDLTFLINIDKAIKLRDAVIDELESWNGILPVEYEKIYYEIIYALTSLIEGMR